MKIKTIYINTHKFDFNFAKICIASVRYWYPDIEIKFIKEFGSGDFNTANVEKAWNASVLEVERKNFGWGYGKLEPLFLHEPHSFLILDADTVIVGPILESIASLQSAFIVDDEIPTSERIYEIYYDLDRINELSPNFKYPGYNFNSGQWFGTSGILKRSDFELSLTWSYPPQPKYPEIIFNGDQSHLNFVLQCKEQFEGLKVSRQKIMIWPNHGKADFLDLSVIAAKRNDYPFVIHWAGLKFKKLNDFPRSDILEFYSDIYYSKMGSWEKLKDRAYNNLAPYQKKWHHKFGKQV